VRERRNEKINSNTIPQSNAPRSARLPSDDRQQAVIYARLAASRLEALTLDDNDDTAELKFETYNTLIFTTNNLATEIQQKRSWNWEKLFKNEDESKR
tara:strand:- start:32 stop:325 length:294 start_codon:yes stop_codon:yes gene_type:complete